MMIAPVMMRKFKAVLSHPEISVIHVTRRHENMIYAQQGSEVGGVGICAGSLHFVAVPALQEHVCPSFLLIFR